MAPSSDQTPECNTMLSKMEALNIYFHTVNKWNAVNEQKRNLNQIIIWWPPFALETAAILLCTLADSVWRNSAGRLLQTSWRTNHRYSEDVGFHILLPLHVIPDTLGDAGMGARWGPCHHFKYFLFFFTLTIALSDIGRMFGVVVQ